MKKKIVHKNHSNDFLLEWTNSNSKIKEKIEITHTHTKNMKKNVIILYIAREEAKKGKS